MKKAQSGLIVSIVVGFVVIMALIVTFLSQRQTQEEIQLTTSSKLINVVNKVENQPSYQINAVKREGYDLQEKPFANGNYDYDERTNDFRLVCTAPCPISKQVLDQEFAAIAYALSTMRGLTQSDIKREFLPFEVHASEDERCPVIDGAAAYASPFTDDNGYVRGKLCFFYDKMNYNRDKFPYSTSVHEVVHLFQYNRLPPYSEDIRAIWEGMAEMMESFFVKGNERNSFCWQGNNWYADEQYANPHDPHGTGRELFFELCTQYGFDYQHLPELFRQIDAFGREVTMREFVSIINSIIGADTSNIFKNAGVNI